MIKNMKALSIAQLANLISMNLRENIPSLSITGEVSNSKMAQSGHWYFNLKDEEASISCVIFSPRSKGISIIEDGKSVIADGSLNFYAKSGSLNFIATQIRESGFGNIAKMLAERANLFKSKGYFDYDKLPLPKYPKRIAIITGERTAGLQDVIKTIKEKTKAVELLVIPCLVQGESAPLDIKKAIDRAHFIDNIDLILLIRGGGSLEDLLCFSDEIVVKACYESKIPILSGLGHEIDNPLCNYSSSDYASTPTQAASKAISNYEFVLIQKNRMIDLIKSKIENTLSSFYDKLSSNQRLIKSTLRLNLKSIREKLNLKDQIYYINKKIIEDRLFIDENRINNLNYMKMNIRNLRKNFDFYKQIIDSNSPKKILSKGFCILKNEKDDLIYSIKDVKEELNILLVDGRVKAKVINKKEEI